MKPLPPKGSGGFVYLAALEGAAPLRRGDAKGAIDAAIRLVPGGALVKDGLGLAAKLLFPG